MGTLVHDSTWFYFSNGIVSWHISSSQSFLGRFFRKILEFLSFLFRFFDIVHLSGLNFFFHLSHYANFGIWFNILLIFWCKWYLVCIPFFFSENSGISVFDIENLSCWFAQNFDLVSQCANFDTRLIFLVLLLFGWHWCLVCIQWTYCLHTEGKKAEDPIGKSYGKKA